METDPDGSRRRFIRLSSTAAILGLAGCSGGGGGEGGETTAATTQTTTQTTAATTSQTRTGTATSVPEQYATATSQGGVERNPESLSPKADVNYQSRPNDGEQCSGCTFFIPDKNGDGKGACAIVEGLVDPNGWCVSYAAYQG